MEGALPPLRYDITIELGCGCKFQVHEGMPSEASIKPTDACDAVLGALSYGAVREEVANMGAEHEGDGGHHLTITVDLVDER